MLRRTLLGTIAATAFVAALPQDTSAQEVYPSRMMRLVVPFPAGGATDVIARLYAAAMSRELGQEMVVENKAGAAGAIGAADVARGRGRADGYSIVFGTATTHALHNIIAKNQQYDAVKDFMPIGLIGAAPLVFVASTKLEGDLKAILQQAKDKPGLFSYGSPGQGTFMHLAAERLKQAAGNPDIAHVGYRGSGPAMNDLVAGQIGLMVDTIATALPQHQAKSVRILAIAAEARSPLAPDIATIDEVMGNKGFAAALWNVVAVPAATPQAIVDKLNAASSKVVADPAFVKRLADLGVDAAKPTTPAQARAYLVDEQASWRPVIERAGIVQN